MDEENKKLEKIIELVERYNTKIQERTHLDKIKALKFVGSYNPFIGGAYSLQYNYAVKRREPNIDDL